MDQETVSTIFSNVSFTIGFTIYIPIIYLFYEQILISRRKGIINGKVEIKIKEHYILWVLRLLCFISFITLYETSSQFQWRDLDQGILILFDGFHMMNPLLVFAFSITLPIITMYSLTWPKSILIKIGKVLLYIFSGYIIATLCYIFTAIAMSV